MSRRVVLTLCQQEYSALLEVAIAELRNPSDQARHIIRQEPCRLGLLEIEELETAPEKVNEGSKGE